jgi:hypothetical protein
VTERRWPSDLSKANFGALTLGVVTNGNFTPIATIDYNQYQRSAYEASAGIIDIPFSDAGSGPLLQSGALAIQVQGETALLEQSYTAETDTHLPRPERAGRIPDHGLPDGRVEFRHVVSRLLDSSRAQQYCAP